MNHVSALIREISVYMYLVDRTLLHIRYIDKSTESVRECVYSNIEFINFSFGAKEFQKMSINN